MQNLPVYLYQNNLAVILDLDPTIRGVNRVMYQHDLKVQKGLKNTVRIQFKNSDQKRISISNTATYVFSMFDAVNQRLIVEKPLDILDDGVTTSTRGLATLTLLESDTVDLTRSSYQFVIKSLDDTGSYSPAYSNTYYGIAGTLQLQSDAFPVLQPSVEVSAFQRSFNSDTDLYEFKSRAVYANPEYNSNSGLHTMAFYMSGYKGTVYIKATLNNDPDYLGSYSTIITKEYNGYTGIDAVNFNGVYSWVEVWHVPGLGPTETDNSENYEYRGTFDKFLYRS